MDAVSQLADVVQATTSIFIAVGFAIAIVTGPPGRAFLDHVAVVTATFAGAGAVFGIVLWAVPRL